MSCRWGGILWRIVFLWTATKRSYWKLLFVDYCCLILWICNTLKRPIIFFFKGKISGSLNSQLWCEQNGVETNCVIIYLMLIKLNYLHVCPVIEKVSCFLISNKMYTNRNVIGQYKLGSYYWPYVQPEQVSVKVSLSTIFLKHMM